MKFFFLILTLALVATHANGESKNSAIENGLQNFKKLKEELSKLETRYSLSLEGITNKAKKEAILKEFHKKRARIVKEIKPLQRKISISMATSKKDYVCGRGKLFEAGALMVCEDGSQWRKSGAAVSPKASIWDQGRDHLIKPLYENEHGLPYYIPSQSYQK